MVAFYNAPAIHHSEIMIGKDRERKKIRKLSPNRQADEPKNYGYSIPISLPDCCGGEQTLKTVESNMETTNNALCACGCVSTYWCVPSMNRKYAHTSQQRISTWAAPEEHMSTCIGIFRPAGNYEAGYPPGGEFVPARRGIRVDMPQSAEFVTRSE